MAKKGSPDLIEALLSLGRESQLTEEEKEIISDESPNRPPVEFR